MPTTAAATYPQIMLPGPIVAGYSITISSQTEDWSGEETSRVIEIPGDGTGLEVVRELNSNYSAWHPFLGCEISIDYGKGAIKRVLDERFGEMHLIEIE